mgnify:CR=1 FL=1
MRLIALIVCLSAVAPVWADCPAAPDHGASIDGLLSDVRAAQSETEAREISSRMWEFWTDAPDEIAQEMLDQGMSRRGSYDFLGALNELNRLVAYCPDYAEGYNQRAFVNYLRQDFAPALKDLDRAIELSPNHIAALSGRALTPAEAMGWGLVDAVVPAEAMTDAAASVVPAKPREPEGWAAVLERSRAELVALDPLRQPAGTAMLETLEHGLRDGEQAGLDAERRNLVALRNSDEGRELIGRFFEKRRPK